MESGGIDELEGVGDSSADGERAEDEWRGSQLRFERGRKAKEEIVNSLDVGKSSSLLDGNADQVVLTDGSDLDGVGELVRRRSRVSIRREKLFRSLGPKKANEKELSESRNATRTNEPTERERERERRT